jgi:CTP:molybdopterin cytidylyltransferase MocA
MSRQAFAGLILAGGEGRRWGGPKAWARLPGGQTFLDICSQTLHTAGANPVLATLPPGSSSAEVDCNAELHVLPREGLDMLASARVGLDRLLEDTHWKAVVVLPVDHPLVDPSTVCALVDAGPPAAIPTFNGRHGHPICLWRQIARRIVAGKEPIENLRDALKAAPTRDVAVGDPGIRINCNTPEALRQGIEVRDSYLLAQQR